MSLDFEYGINIGNRFSYLLGDEEDPSIIYARSTEIEEQRKKAAEEKRQKAAELAKKQAAAKAKKKKKSSATKSASSIPSNEKDDIAKSSVKTDQSNQGQSFKEPESTGSSNDHKVRTNSGRGGRGFSRSAEFPQQEPVSHDGTYHRRGYRRPQRTTHPTTQSVDPDGNSFQQDADIVSSDPEKRGTEFGNFRGRGRGRGRGPGYERPGGRFFPRGRGGRGRGYNYFRDRNFEEVQEQQPNIEQPQNSIDSSSNNTQAQPATVADQEINTWTSPQNEFESNYQPRGGRRVFRARVFRSSRGRGDSGHHGNDRADSGFNPSYRPYRHQRDRQPHSAASGVEATESKHNEEIHTSENTIGNTEETNVKTEINETTEEQPQAPPKSREWSDMVEEAEKQRTYDEYKKEQEAKKQAQKEKLPQIVRRAAGEGEDPKRWRKYEQIYRKKNDDDGTDDEQTDEDSEHSDTEVDQVQIDEKKKTVSIEFHFKPVELQRGSMRSRGGFRRGSADRFQYPSNRGESYRPNTWRQEQSFHSEYAGDYRSDEQQVQSRPSRGRGGSGRGYGRGEYHRVYSNSVRRGGSRGSQNNSTTIDFANTDDFPTLQHM